MYLGTSEYTIAIVEANMLYYMVHAKKKWFKQLIETYYTIHAIAENKVLKLLCIYNNNTAIGTTGYCSCEYVQLQH